MASIGNRLNRERVLELRAALQAHCDRGDIPGVVASPRAPQPEASLDDTVSAKHAITVRDVLTYTFGLGSVMAPFGTYPIQKPIREGRLGGDGPEYMLNPPPRLSAKAARSSLVITAAGAAASQLTRRALSHGTCQAASAGSVGWALRPTPIPRTISSALVFTQRLLDLAETAAVFTDFWKHAYRTLEP
jgi:hypothetical protein